MPNPGVGRFAKWAIGGAYFASMRIETDAKSV